MSAKILFIAAGRRNSLVQRFQAEGFEVACAEMSHQVPVTKVCPVYVTPSQKDIHRLLEEKHFDLILPLNDEYAAYAHLNFTSAQTITIASSWDAAIRCYNKRGLQEWMEYHCPAAYPSFQWGKEFVRKPRHGNSSKNITYHRSYDVWRMLKDLPEYDFIYQRKIAGIEHSVDAYFDRRSKFVDCVARTRDRVAGGEVVNSTVVPKSVEGGLRAYTKFIGEKLRLRGPTCFQFISDTRTNQEYLIEINARFGGGSILSIEAGLNMPRMIYDEYVLGKSPRERHSGQIKQLTMKRYNSETFFAL